MVNNMRTPILIWCESMLIRFANLEDACCPMGKSLKPIANLNRGIGIIQAYTKALEQIMNKKDMKLGKYDLDSWDFAFERGRKEALNECAAIAEDMLDSKL